MLDENGRMEDFNNDLVIRYLDRVIVKDDGYEVAFKAGVTVEAESWGEHRAAYHCENGDVATRFFRGNQNMEQTLTEIYRNGKLILKLAQGKKIPPVR